MYTLNKIIGFLINPIAMAALGVVVALVLNLVRVGRWAKLVLIASVAWAWIWATPLMTRILGASLESPYLVDGHVPVIENYPNADIIELHGGSMGVATNMVSRGEMWGSADRVWMAARLWKAGKAPKILVTSKGTDWSTGGLLEDFGVPKEAIVYDFEPRNTEEEAKAVAQMFECSECSNLEKKPKVLVVTSAWHMQRTMLMYEKYAPEVEAIPAPCDFENMMVDARVFSIGDFLPHDEAIAANRIALHEWLGYFGYKWFR